MLCLLHPPVLGGCSLVGIAAAGRCCYCIGSGVTGRLLESSGSQPRGNSGRPLPGRAGNVDLVMDPFSTEQQQTETMSPLAAPALGEYANNTGSNEKKKKSVNTQCSANMRVYSWEWSCISPNNPPSSKLCVGV